MTLLTPIYLLLLLPWAGVVAWVLFGRAEFARVSTTLFWEKTETSTRTRRGIRRPPLWAVLMLVAMLAAILAASGLGVYGSGPRVRWVVDRGLLTITGLQHDEALRNRIDASRATAVPESDDLFRATTLDTTASIRLTVDRLLLETTEPIVVVTSRPITIGDPRVTVIRPAHTAANVGIEHFAIATTPRPQAMLRVWNGTTARTATLRVGAATQTIDLLATGESKDFFVDIAPPGEVIEASIDVDDDIDADDRAWLVRSRAVPRVAPAPGLGESVRRFAAVYDQERRPMADAPVVSLTDDPNAASPAVVLRSGTSTAAGEIRAADHPVTRWIDWPAVASLVRSSLASEPPRGTPVVWIGDRPVVSADAGRVEIGFDVSTLASHAAFVLLMENAIEFASDGRSEYASVSTSAIGAGWDVVSTPVKDVDYPPGVYQEMSERRAANVAAVRPPATPITPNPPMPTGGREVVPLERVLLIVSLAGVVGGLFCLTPHGRRVR